MAEKVLKREKAHTRYYIEQDGKKIRVPGVTTILGIMDKPALVGWANRLGLDGIDVRSYVDSKAEIGHCAHYLIECHLKGATPDVTEFSGVAVDLAENGFLKFLSWLDQFQFEFIASEMGLSSAQHMFGGTCDVYCKLNGTPTLLDIKTSGSGIYSEMKDQATAYLYLLRENGYPCDQAYIVRVGRDETGEIESALVTDLGLRWERFLHCRAIYELNKQTR